MEVMKRIASFFILAALTTTAFAGQDPLGDLKAAVIQEDYKEAGRLAGKLLKDPLARPQLQEVTYFLGLSHLRQGEYPQAEDVFRKLLTERLSMDLYDKTAIGLIDAYLLQGAYEPALKEVNSLLARRKDSESLGLIYLKAGRVNLKLARWKKAREFLQKVVDEYPDSFEAGVAKQLLDEKQYFTVQVGSFLDQDRAEKMMREMQSRKEYAYIVEVKSPEGKSYYRVRVGQLVAIRDAQALEQKLSGLGYPTLIYP